MPHFSFFGSIQNQFGSVQLVMFYIKSTSEVSPHVAIILHGYYFLTEMFKGVLTVHNQ